MVSNNNKEHYDTKSNPVEEEVQTYINSLFMENTVEMHDMHTTHSFNTASSTCFLPSYLLHVYRECIPMHFVISWKKKKM